MLMSMIPSPENFPVYQVSPQPNSKPLQPGRQPRFKLASTAAAPLQPPPSLVDGLIAQNSLFIIYGDNGTGKSFLALDLLGSITTGLDWMGYKTQKGKVIYIGLEGAGTITLRQAAWRQDRNLPNAAFSHLSEGFFELTNPSDIDDLIATIKSEEEAPVLVVFDTLSRAIGGEDENNAAVMSAVVAGADKIRRETGAAVGIVHHSGKADSRTMRGSSVLPAAADTILKVSGRSGTRECVVAKRRDGVIGDRFRFQIKPVHVSANNGKTVSSAVAEPVSDQIPASGAVNVCQSKYEQQVLDLINRLASEKSRYALASNGSAEVSISVAELRKHAQEELWPNDKPDTARNRMNRILERLIRDGKIRRPENQANEIIVFIEAGGAISSGTNSSD